MACELSDIKNVKLGTGRTSQGIEGYGGVPLWRRRPVLDCSANVEEEDIYYVLKWCIHFYSPRSGTSSNASTPSTKKLDSEKPTTPISKSVTPTSGGSGSSTAAGASGLKPVVRDVYASSSVVGQII